MQKRDTSLDIFKGSLVIGMIIAHVIGLLSEDLLSTIFPRYITIFVNCITFSGFAFCFGYVNKLAYLSKDLKSVYKRILLNVGKTYIAYLISGVSNIFLIDQVNLSLWQVLKIALFIEVPKLSEFLITFSLFSLFTFFAFKPIKHLLKNKRVFWLVCGVLLLATFLPPIHSNWGGLFIGTDSFKGFPLLPYLPFFLTGMYFAEYKIIFNKNILIGSLAGTLISITYLLITHTIPTRFPPSLLWIISPLVILYAVYLLSHKIKSEILEFIGRNVLFYLLMSNIILFSLQAASKYRIPLDPIAIYSMLVSLLLILVITFLAKLVSKPN
jgi:hypothetical protein